MEIHYLGEGGRGVVRGDESSQAKNIDINVSENHKCFCTLMVFFPIDTPFPSSPFLCLPHVRKIEKRRQPTRACETFVSSVGCEVGREKDENSVENGKNSNNVR